MTARRCGCSERQPGLEPGDHRHHQEDNRPPVDWGYPTYGEYFQGLIDQVRVYDRVLSPPELRAEMSTPSGSAPPSRAAGLVAAYAFDKGSGTVAADASGNGNAGAIIGATWAPEGRFGGARCGSTAPARSSACPRQRR